ncbi:hypothetical protein ACWC10_27805 [Streptomyces sp. NPDC001595]|uniref:hypothetical protein n=1 Tax=Streptomyces sp. NPDC001532 TaxID=3154520 RepID=UPI00331EF9FC
MRRLSGAALAALCALAMSACGTERAADDDGTRARPAARAGAESPADEGAASGDAELLEYMRLLIDLAEPCVGEPPMPTLPEEEARELAELEAARQSGSAPPEPAAPPLPTDEPPSGTPVDPSREVELAPAEKCEADVHARRIAETLRELSEPRPAQVAERLRGLGYPEASVDGPRSSGDRVEFIVDLRLMDGQLCLAGSTSGGRTETEPYGASPEVECADVRR